MPLSQSESWCIVFHIKKSFHSCADKTHFHMKGFARGLALKKRHKTIRKWPIMIYFDITTNSCLSLSLCFCTDVNREHHA